MKGSVFTDQPGKLERWPTLVAFTQTNFGKVLMTALLALGLASAGQHGSSLVIICLLFPIFLPEYGAKTIIALNLFCCLVWGSVYENFDMFYATDLLNSIIYFRYGYPSSAFLGLNALVIVLAFFVTWSISKAANTRILRGENFIAFFLILFIFLIFATNAFRYSPILFELSLGLMIFLGRIVFYFLFSYQQESAADFRSHLRKFLTYVPFWNLLGHDHGPIPIGHKAIYDMRNRTAQERAALRISALRLLFWCALARYSGVILTQIVLDRRAPYWFGLEGVRVFLVEHVPILFWHQNLPSLNLPNFAHMDLATFNALHLPFYKIWLIAVSATYGFLSTYLWAPVGATVAVVRFCGISTPRPVYRPFEATSFTDFFRRLMFYYNQMIVQFFLFPIAQVSSRWRMPRKPRRFFTTFLAVFSGAFCIHLFRFSARFDRLGLNEIYQMQIDNVPYYSLLALFCGISSMKLGLLHRAHQAIRVSVYCVLYMFCLVFFLMKHGTPLSERILWFESMFGFTG